MIKSITLDPPQIVISCEGTHHNPSGSCRCNCERTISLLDLVLGFGDPTMVNKDVIVLPPCEDCAAATSLFRNWDTTPEEHHGTPHDLTRRAVNALAEWLKAQGKICLSCQSAVAAEGGVPLDMGTLPYTAEQ